VRYHAVVLVVAGALAYATSLSNPFLYDDQTAIVKNPQIRTLSPLSVPLTPPRDTPVAGRPLVNLSLAANYAFGGLDAHSVTEVFAQNAARIQQVVLDMIGRFPADLDALGARGLLEFSRGDGHVITPDDIRLFETGL